MTPKMRISVLIQKPAFNGVFIVLNIKPPIERCDTKVAIFYPNRKTALSNKHVVLNIAFKCRKRSKVLQCENVFAHVSVCETLTCF